MDPIWLSIAFGLGLLARLIGLPPLVGFLVAGFALNFFGAKAGTVIEIISELGVLLLLFSIGLKLKIKKLLRKEIWAGASIHMIATTLVFFVMLLVLSQFSFTLFNGFTNKTALLIAFALSFSSTIYAVKILEENGELNSLHGIVSIGLLIMQDIFAVVFIVLASGKTPSIWALGLPVLLFAIRPLLMLIFNKIGHGELLVLYGFFLALILGAELFEFVGLKADLGALVIGMLVAEHKKSKELADTLLHFKDILLIGFFLSIGFMGIPNWELIILAIVLSLGINFKAILYFLVLTRFKLRARTSVFTSLVLANFSEFGLIVMSFAVAANILQADWLVVMAISLSISFIISSPLNLHAHSIYARIKNKLRNFETSERLEYDKTFDIGNAQILIFGLGRLGSATYDQLRNKYGESVLGLDFSLEIVEKQKLAGRNVIHDDATDSEFWERITANPIRRKQVKMIMLCMDNHNSNKYALQRLNAINYDGMIAVTALYEDHRKELETLKNCTVYDLYTEAGHGFADNAFESIKTADLSDSSKPTG